MQLQVQRAAWTQAKVATTSAIIETRIQAECTCMLSYRLWYGMRLDVRGTCLQLADVSGQSAKAAGI